jgi:hypothetical protein
MTTYYVSSILGSDNNAGTTATAPLASLQAAADLVHPGDTVLVMNGTYTNGGNDVLTISTSGTAGAPIIFEAAPGATPIIDSSGAGRALRSTPRTSRSMDSRSSVMPPITLSHKPWRVMGPAIPILMATASVLR